jgi:hypothetical protein
MNFDEYTTSPLGRGRVQIMFTQPISQDWEISLFMRFFEKHKRKIAVTFKTKPEIEIEGLICHHRTWSSFLKHIQREQAAVEYDESMGSLDYDEMVDYLEKCKEAGIREQKRQLSIIKERNEKNKRNN